ncbi:FkbM family methyltransferase [Methanolinea mesophila]|uniref:FkbM family methyltransferase n=1 Tax=Methanolinea mesophila TaxID=547055 RepID=UPI001AE20D2B|nr:FkbM family methyltransferase [Methanolinea mesophila]MBP1928349.1 FkbM family methyltransferase [Methanolinea mesophila]
MIVRIKQLIENIILSDRFSSQLDCTRKKERFGSRFGGWDVAVEDISKDSVVYSFGIGEDASFDLEMIQRLGVTIHAFDPPPKSIQWVHEQHFPDSFIVHEYGLADFDGVIKFNPPKNPNHVSHTILDRPETGNNAIIVDVKKLKTIMRELEHQHVDILKMDIEGAEYQVIHDLIESKIIPTQILVEFHHRFPNVGVPATEEAIMELKKAGYCLFSVSGNNEDFCFIFNNKNKLKRKIE